MDIDKLEQDMLKSSKVFQRINSSFNTGVAANISDNKDRSEEIMRILQRMCEGTVSGMFISYLNNTEKNGLFQSVNCNQTELECCLLAEKIVMIYTKIVAQNIIDDVITWKKWKRTNCNDLAELLELSSDENKQKLLEWLADNIDNAQISRAVLLVKSATKPAPKPRVINHRTNSRRLNRMARRAVRRATIRQNEKNQVHTSHHEQSQVPIGGHRITNLSVRNVHVPGANGPGIRSYAQLTGKY